MSHVTVIQQTYQQPQTSAQNFNYPAAIIYSVLQYMRRHNDPKYISCPLIY